MQEQKIYGRREGAVGHLVFNNPAKLNAVSLDMWDAFVGILRDYEKDPEGRQTIFDTLATQGLPRVLSIGRLDINTEGLLLLTNDGGLARVLELPSTAWLRRYRVRAWGKVEQPALDALRRGVTIDDIRYGPIEATLDREQGANV